MMTVYVNSGVQHMIPEQGKILSKDAKITIVLK